MQIAIDEGVSQQVQSLTHSKLKWRDYDFLLIGCRRGYSHLPLKIVVLTPDHNQNFYSLALLCNTS